jgi:hypothetical protein
VPIRNDRDGTVEHGERLRTEDETGRRCIVRNIAVQAGAVFFIEEQQLTDCGQ